MSTLAEELPYAAVVVNDLLALVCSKCFSTNDDKPLSRCSRCKVAHYCGSQCQKDDWIDHKFECTFLQRVAPRVPSSVPRLIARIALKEKRADTPPAFNGRLFSDLMDHRDSLQKDPQRTEFFACIAHVLYEYMGAEQVPSAKQLMSYFGKICINCFEIQDDNFRTLGEGVYVGLSAHDHSCRPAAFVHFEGAKAVLRTPDRAVKYTKQVTISYSSAMQLQSVRRRELREQYYFTCQCALCEDERQDAVARSTVCSFCPEGVCPVDASVERLVCYSCGRPSGMEMMQAIRTNQELEWTLERMKDEKPQDQRTELARLIAVYEKCSKVLSPLNISLALLAQKILLVALQLDRQDICVQYAESAVPAYKHYLPEGHPELTIRLKVAAFSASLAEPPTGRVLQLLEEACASALLSHGPRHWIASSLDRALSAYRARLDRHNY